MEGHCAASGGIVFGGRSVITIASCRSEGDEPQPANRSSKSTAITIPAQRPSPQTKIQPTFRRQSKRKKQNEDQTPTHGPLARNSDTTTALPELVALSSRAAFSVDWIRISKETNTVGIIHNVLNILRVANNRFSNRR